MTTLASRALTILHEWVQSQSLRKHCYAVADSMKHFAHLRGTDVAEPDACRRKRAMKRERNLRLLIVDGRGDDLELCVRSRLRAKLNERRTDESNMERRDARRKR